MNALTYYSILFGLGVYLIGDGWYSLLHYQRTEETFFRNNIFRWLRLLIGIWMINMALYFSKAVGIK